MQGPHDAQFAQRERSWPGEFVLSLPLCIHVSSDDIGCLSAKGDINA